MGRHLPDDLVRETFPDGKTNVTYADDAKVSEEVWESVQPFIRENNFN
jgi:hypothetical protein